MEVKKGHGHIDPYTTLYRVHWVEADEIKKSSIRGARSAFKYMEKLLAEGIPSWMVAVPWEADDIPF